MKKYFPLLLLSLAGLFIQSCKQENGCGFGTYDYLLFGYFYGECGGEQCIEIFKLEDGHLFEDQKDDYPYGFSPYNGRFKKLEGRKYDLVSSLPSLIPDLLIQHPDTVYGQPDAGDWGGIYLEYSVQGEVKIWYLDQMKANMPAELGGIVDHVNQAIEAVH